MKRSTLEKTYLVFSGLVALGTRPEDSEYWKLAETFGAKCGNDLREGVTHLVANQVRYYSLGTFQNDLTRLFAFSPVLRKFILLDEILESRLSTLNGY